MDIHEYQAKALLKEYGVPIPFGGLAYSPEQAAYRARESGGPQEAEAAEFARDHMHKKVVTYIAGLSAPKGRTMGHAGAIVTGSGESAAEKIEIMRECRIPVIERPSDFGTAIAKMI